MEKLIILNHKMNLEYDEVVPYITRLNQIETKQNMIVLPSNLYLESFMNHCTWGVGAQNVHAKESGNYTGEVSVLQLKSMGVEYVMIGHYERKKYFHETNQQIREKLNACIDANLIPILCFGETGNLDDVRKALDELLKGIDNIQFIVFAYEPLKVANPDDLEQIEMQIEAIYQYLYEKYHSIPNIVYGGGIRSQNVHQLFQIEKLNGILIGKISANIEKIEKIVKSIDS